MDSMQYFFTFIVGILVFVVGRFFEKLVIDPIQRQKYIIGEIEEKLIVFENVYKNPRTSGSKQDQTVLDAQRDLRELSAKLRAYTSTIPYYKAFRFFFFRPSLTNIHEACGDLIGLSNNLWTMDDPDSLRETINQNKKYQENISNKLKIKNNN